MSKYKLTVAPNGARRQKHDHRALPLTTAEIAQTALECHVAGADEIHLHVRNNDGTHSLDAGRYRDAIAAVTQAAPNMSIQITTESAGVFSVEDQFNCLATLRPQAASVSIREMARDAKIAARTYALASETKTQIQHILYTPNCVAQLLNWQNTGVVPTAMSDVIFVLGQYDPPILAQPNMLDHCLGLVDNHQITWTVCAFGQYEHPCLAAGIANGGNVRIGFENSIEMPDGTLWDSNAASVAKFIQDNPK